jgi:hypothetical protein
MKQRERGTGARVSSVAFIRPLAVVCVRGVNNVGRDVELHRCRGFDPWREEEYDLLLRLYPDEGVRWAGCVGLGWSRAACWAAVLGLAG